MKKIYNILLLATSIVLSPFAFAGKDTTMNLNVVNMTFASADPFIYDDNFNITQGPIMAKNGGNIQWSPSLADSLYGLGIIYPNGIESTCSQNHEAQVLNPEIYKGDTIVVIYSTDQSGNVVCTCTGSACDISVAKH